MAPATLGIIRRLVAQKAMAEDLLQDTLIAMFEHLDDFRGEAPFGVWVRSIAVSRCLMAFRSPWHRARVALESWTEDSWRGPAESDSRTSDLIDLDRALARLSPVTRTVVWLYDVEGWSHEEIAQGLRPHGEFFQVAAGARTRAAAQRLAAAGAVRRSAFRSGVSSMDTDRQPTTRTGRAAEAARCERRRGGAGLRLRRHCSTGMRADSARARRRLALARGTASALVVALVGASVWRFEQRGVDPPEAVVMRAPVAQTRRRRSRASCAPTPISPSPRSRTTSPASMTRSTYARLRGGTADVARLERTRAELIDSYTQVRYAEMVSANF